MLKRAQFPFPNPLPPPSTVDEKLYWVVFGACLAASWSRARGGLVSLFEVENFIDVAVEHTRMRAQARENGDANDGPRVVGVVQAGFGKDRPS
jgi:hypothetical protein